MLHFCPLSIPPQQNNKAKFNILYTHQYSTYIAIVTTIIEISIYHFSHHLFTLYTGDKRIITAELPTMITKNLIGDFIYFDFCIYFKTFFTLTTDTLPVLSMLTIKSAHSIRILYAHFLFNIISKISIFFLL